MMPSSPSLFIHTAPCPRSDETTPSSSIACGNGYPFSLSLSAALPKVESNNLYSRSTIAHLMHQIREERSTTHADGTTTAGIIHATTDDPSPKSSPVLLPSSLVNGSRPPLPEKVHREECYREALSRVSSPRSDDSGRDSPIPHCPSYVNYNETNEDSSDVRSRSYGVSPERRVDLTDGASDMDVVELEMSVISTTSQTSKDSPIPQLVASYGPWSPTLYVSQESLYMRRAEEDCSHSPKASPPSCAIAESDSDHNRTDRPRSNTRSPSSPAPFPYVTDARNPTGEYEKQRMLSVYSPLSQIPLSASPQYQEVSQGPVPAQHDRYQSLESPTVYPPPHSSSTPTQQTDAPALSNPHQDEREGNKSFISSADLELRVTELTELVHHILPELSKLREEASEWRSRVEYLEREVSALRSCTAADQQAAYSQTTHTAMTLGYREKNEVPEKKCKALLAWDAPDRLGPLKLRWKPLTTEKDAS